MSLIHGVLIPANPDAQMEVRHLEAGDLRTYQAAVGGYIEAVTLFDPAMTLYCDEEGKLKRRPLNIRATDLVIRHTPRFDDVIVGDALLLGGPTPAGNDRSIPTEVLSRLMGT